MSKSACYLLVAVLVAWPVELQGQDTDGSGETDSVESTTEKPDVPEKVDVQPIARDEEIAARLTNILQATEWFVDTTVEVKDGVVFLEGTAAQDPYRVWASDLASNTQDVAAVVNRMSVRSRSIVDMSPATAELKKLATATIQSLPLVLFGAITMAVTWGLAGLVKRIANWFFSKKITNGLLRSVVAKACVLPVFLVGTYIVLRVSGLTQLALTVLGGTGIAGLIIGIAFRDIAENFLASILISVQNPFRNGDLIQVGDHVGFVQRVSTRGTLLMTFDGNHVQIPNSIIYKSTVTNLTANPNRRVEFRIGIGYGDSISLAQKVVKRVLREHPSVLADPESRIILDEFGPSTVNLRVYAWLDASKNSPDTVRSSAMRLVKQALLQEGISLPDESREVIFPQGVPVQMVSVDGQESAKQNAGEALRRDSESVPVLSHADDPREEVVSEGEGSHQSDADDIKRQAAGSWSPEQGANLLDAAP